MNESNLRKQLAVKKTEINVEIADLMVDLAAETDRNQIIALQQSIAFLSGEKTTISYVVELLHMPDAEPLINSVPVRRRSTKNV